LHGPEAALLLLLRAARAQNAGEAVGAKLLRWFEWIRSNDGVFDRVYGEMAAAVRARPLAQLPTVSPITVLRP